ncbi:MAG: signal recognition particle protein [Clostridia bacterium]|nr:signal recognition particle protein [Clostridia bacterium]
MFEGLSERLQGVFARLRGRGRLSEQDVQAALREIRLALLEADVNFKVVKDFVERVRERAVGQEVLESLTPAQQVVKIVHEELARLLGEGADARLAAPPKPPLVVLMVGLQGSGKTTSTAKLGLHLKRQGKRPLLVAADVYRPAAADQLETLGRSLEIPVYRLDGAQPEAIVAGALQEAERAGRDAVLIDTAGRLHVDEELMAELRRLHALSRPHETLLVVDAMTGQDAVSVAEGFCAELPITGIVMTKLDGDARGGAALSVRAVTGRPIKFAGVGEKTDALEPFHADRMASRILGMGDVLTLIEKAQAAVDVSKARELEAKLRQNEFTFEDFLEQMQQLRRMGPLEQILGLLPGMGNFRQLKGVAVDEKELARVEAIIRSMTPEERRRPQIIDSSRKRRIARGSGTQVQDVNRLLKQFEELRKVMRMFSRPGKRPPKPGRLPFGR